MDRRHAPPVEEPPTPAEGGDMEADGLPGDPSPGGSGRDRAPLFDPRTGRIFGTLVAVACALLLLVGVLLAERAVQRLIYPPTATPEPTPDIRPLGPGYVQGPPSVDVAHIRRVLQAYNSPAVDEAQAFYDLGVARGIDPAWCLAFFIMESGAGTQGVARTTYSIGNIRALPGQPSFEGYRRYTSWREGIGDWYRLIDEVYIRDRGETTIDTIVPVYAPSHDQNDPDAYIRTVKRLVARWRGY
jgi:hypothetical protein